MFDTKPYESRMQAALVHYEDELKKVRTGRAHPNMLDGVIVTAYGANMPLNQVANVTVPESTLLQVTPFDPANLQAIADAIRNDQSLGFNPSDDGRVVRVPIPALTTERRQEIVKQLQGKAEESRISLRNVRHDALRDAKSKKEAKEISEDDYKRVGSQLDTLMTDFNGKIDAAAKVKETEILTI